MSVGLLAVQLQYGLYVFGHLSKWFVFVLMFKFWSASRLVNGRPTIGYNLLIEEVLRFITTHVIHTPSPRTEAAALQAVVPVGAGVAGRPVEAPAAACRHGKRRMRPTADGRKQARLNFAMLLCGACTMVFAFVGALQLS